MKFEPTSKNWQCCRACNTFVIKNGVKRPHKKIGEWLYCMDCVKSLFTGKK